MRGKQNTNTHAQQRDAVRHSRMSDNAFSAVYANVYLETKAGNLYETTEYDRASGTGTVFEIN